jgi:hypothetical protein
MGTVESTSLEIGMEVLTAIGRAVHRPCSVRPEALKIVSCAAGRSVGYR